MMHDQMQNIKARADCLISAESIERIIQIMAKKITELLVDKNPLVLIVMKGGVIFAGHLLPHLEFPLELDYLHATRYNNQLSGNQLIWKAKPDIEVAGRHVLVLDDILDEGATLLEVLAVLKAQGAAHVYSAVLINKLHARKVAPNWLPDFVGVDLPDKYLFGFGMDYKGYWRNANGIYAAADEDIS